MLKNLPVRHYQKHANYSNKLHLDTAGLILGASHRSEPEKYDAEFVQFAGNPRVWIVFSHYWYVNGISEAEIILTYCNSRGRLVDSYQCTGAAAYLYDFSLRRP